MPDGEPVTTGTPAGVGAAPDAGAAATPAVPSVSGAEAASGAPAPPPAAPAAPATTTTFGVNANPPPPAPAPAAPAPVAEAPRAGSPSDPENRIRELQSRGDRLQTDLDKRNQAYVDLETRAKALEAELNSTKGERSAVLNTAAEKVQSAMTEQEQLRAQNAELAGKLARLEAVRNNPELAAYADFLPVTTDADKLSEAVETLKAARQRDLAAVSGSLSAGVQGHPATGAPPPIAAGTPPATAGDIRARLLAAKTPDEFTQLAKQLDLEIQAARRTPGT